MFKLNTKMNAQTSRRAAAADDDAVASGPVGRGSPVGGTSAAAIEGMMAVSISKLADLLAGKDRVMADLLAGKDRVMADLLAEKDRAIAKKESIIAKKNDIILADIKQLSALKLMNVLQVFLVFF